jgi:hypothetical protein
MGRTGVSVSKLCLGTSFRVANEDESLDLG